MHIVVASDYAGSHLQQRLLDALGHTVEDLGTSNTALVDYLDPAQAIATAILSERRKRALLCGHGQLSKNDTLGCITTPTPPIRVRSRAHVDAPILGGRVFGKELAHELKREFLNARHTLEEPAPMLARQERRD